MGDLLAGKEVYDAGHRLFFQGPSKGGHRKWHKSPEELAAHKEKNRQVIRDAVAKGKHVAIIDNGDPTIFGPAH